MTTINAREALVSRTASEVFDAAKILFGLSTGDAVKGGRVTLKDQDTGSIVKLSDTKAIAQNSISLAESISPSAPAVPRYDTRLSRAGEERRYDAVFSSSSTSPSSSSSDSIFGASIASEDRKQEASKQAKKERALKGYYRRRLKQLAAEGRPDAELAAVREYLRLLKNNPQAKKQTKRLEIHEGMSEEQVQQARENALRERVVASDARHMGLPNTPERERHSTHTRER